ncbi:NPCBM/NEW2 domain-containing protein [Actinosynnema sp. NPDC023658]|uniref:NPCBM/NEW2 domain-containing protein n=1 Tax=Actinosynnema sp. NPDC023658 TaxID=3155465 RepID=UPI0033FC5096
MDDARARRGTGKVVGLSIAGVAVLGLGMFLGSTFDAEPVATPRETSTQAGAPTSTSTTTTTAAAGPGATWLADLAPVDSSSIDDMYVESPWTASAAKVGKTTYTKAISADGAWCSSAQLTFALDGKYERFSAQVAIAGDSLETKPLDFYVLTDDQRVAEVQNVGTAPKAVDVPLAGKSRLTIGVEPPTADPSDCPGPERVGVWADPTLTAAG